MKTSVLKASKKASEDLWAQFKSQNEKIGRERFKRVDNENGFSISGPMCRDGKFVKNEEGKVKRTTIFKYESNEIGSRISWDENAIDI